MPQVNEYSWMILFSKIFIMLLVMIMSLSFFHPYMMKNLKLMYNIKSFTLII